MIVVTNSGPLMALAKLGLLDLLPWISTEGISPKEKCFTPQHGMGFLTIYTYLYSGPIDNVAHLY